MKNCSAKFAASALFLAFACVFSACSTVPTAQAPVADALSILPHPQSLKRDELMALMQSSGAPKAALGEFADRCDEDFSDKNALTLVKENQTLMHWCFYAKLTRLQIELQEDAPWSARQKKVQKAFRFLSPIAAAFSAVAHDDRYAQWERRYSAKVSEWVFFRKPVLNRVPASTSETKKP